MLTPQAFSYADARPPEGKSFAAEQLVGYRGAARPPVDTAAVASRIVHLEADLAAANAHPSTALTREDILKIGRGEMTMPPHILAAGPVGRRPVAITAQIARLNEIKDIADAHNEALAAGLNQLGSEAPQADSTGAST